MARRKRSIVPSPCCMESEAKDTKSCDASCECKCPSPTCDQKSVGAECTTPVEDTSCPEFTATDSGSCQRYYCNAICGKKQVLALAGPTIQTVSCTTIRHKPKKKVAYSTIHGLPQPMSACSPTCESPLQTSLCAHSCRIPLHLSPCTNRPRLPLQFTSSNTQSVGLSDPCTTLCTNNGQCNTPSGPCCTQSSCPQSCTSGNEAVVMTAYLPITIKLCQPTCSSNVPCKCASPCKSPTCSNCCKK